MQEPRAAKMINNLAGPVGDTCARGESRRVFAWLPDYVMKAGRGWRRSAPTKVSQRASASAVQEHRNGAVCGVALRSALLPIASGAPTLRAVATALFMLFVSAAQAATPDNAQSPLGLNLSGVSYYSAEQPFLDIFKTAAINASNPREGWITHGASTWDTHEEAYLQLDANGFPTTLKASSADPNSPQLYTQVCTVLLFNLPQSNAGSGLPYRAGQYTVLYDGQGSLSYGFDAVVLSRSPGRDLIRVRTPTHDGGFLLCITATDPRRTGNNLRNIRVVYSAEADLLRTGQIFRPGFLQLLQNFRVLRFVDWGRTNNNTVRSWSSRSQVADGGYGTDAGVPWEIDLALANAVGAYPWLNIPAEADDDYIRQLAMLAHTSLDNKLEVYIEYSNEVWNTVFSQSQYAASHGQTLWPKAGAPQATLDWHGMRTAQMCDIWKSVWGGDFHRVHCVLGAQTANLVTATESLNCPLWTGVGNAPCARHNITEVAICWYFSFAVPPSWSTLAEADQLDNLFAELNRGGLIAGDHAGGYLKQASEWEAAYAAALKPYHLPFIGYEGGQSFSGALASRQYGAGSWAVKLYAAASRDPRMLEAYITALKDWKANGGRVAAHYNDIGAPSQWGEWGALESFLDTTSPLTSAPPKWRGLQTFISSNPCWWPGCSATSSAARK